VQQLVSWQVSVFDEENNDQGREKTETMLDFGSLKGYLLMGSATLLNIRRAMFMIVTMEKTCVLSSDS